MRELARYYPLIAYTPLIELLVCAFNAILFVLVSFYCVRDYRRRGTQWGAYIYAYVVVLCALLFIGHLGNDFATELAHHRYGFFDVLEIGSKYLIAPLVFHLFYRDERDYLPARRIWPVGLVILYGAAILSGAAELNIGVIGFSQGWPGWSVVRLLFRGLMIGAATGSAAILWMSRSPGATALHQKRRHWLMYACWAWAATFVVGAFLPEQWDSILGKVVPLGFIFMITYYVERFTFFDLLIKRGAFIFASLLLLCVYFVAVPPLLLRLGFRTWVGTLVWAMSVWPMALIAPWGQRRLSLWVDRRFLGRAFSPAQATQYFLGGLQGLIEDKELARQAETRLSAIFKAHSEVYVGELPCPPPQDTDEFMAVPLQRDGATFGYVRVQKREHHLRFLSEDVALLTSLAGALAFLLENLQLREKRLEQEQRERELLLNANRWELKALRAQINPHFLFNALNTIAGLIPRHPERAEETIEELAEVFRYTLRRSEREWVRLDEELEAVRSYLRIEQARFGERLQFRIESNAEAEEVRIPAMLIQTLVENGVKHGVAKLMAAGLVEVRVETAAETGDVCIEVRDNGPGFTGFDVTKLGRTGSGYGLCNVQERLRRYFGEAGKVSLGRDEGRNMTLVRIEMPNSSRVLGVPTR